MYNFNMIDILHTHSLVYRLNIYTVYTRPNLLNLFYCST